MTFSPFSRWWVLYAFTQDHPRVCGSVLLALVVGIAVDLFRRIMRLTGDTEK